MSEPSLTAAKTVVPPSVGEAITSLRTGNTYTMGEKIGEGAYGQVFACSDIWENDLAAKVLKPTASYDEVQARAIAEVQKLEALRKRLWKQC